MLSWYIHRNTSFCFLNAAFTDNPLWGWAQHSKLNWAASRDHSIWNSWFHEANWWDSCSQGKELCFSCSVELGAWGRCLSSLGKSQHRWAGGSWWDPGGRKTTSGVVAAMYKSWNTSINESPSGGMQEVVRQKVPRAGYRSTWFCSVVFQHSHYTLSFELSLASFKAYQQVQAWI